MTYWLSICFAIIAVLTIIKLWTKELNIREYLILLFASITITGFLIGVGSYRNDSDVQIINGQVVSKQMQRVSCSHSYSCNCHTSCSGSGKHRHCSTHCSTCYEHSFDQDWNVYTTVGPVRINRLDRRGMQEPPRWTAVLIGEPAAATVSYTNYIKAAPESLFHKVASHRYRVPEYPTNIQDYYRYNRVVSVNTSLPFAKDLNDTLNYELRKLGPYKQVNIVSVFTTYDQNFGSVLEQEWLGGKKNDVVVVVGLYSDLKTIRWVKVFSWSKSSLVNYQIEDGLRTMKTFEISNYLAVVTASIKDSFIRRPMSDFQYLEDAVEPPDWAIFTSIIIALLIVGFGGYYTTREGVDL